MKQVDARSGIKMVGILIMFFGILGCLSGYQLLSTYNSDTYETDLIKQIEEQVKADELNEADLDESFLEIPDWFDSYLLFLGLAGLLIHLFYAYCGFSYFKLKENSKKLVYRGIGASLGLVILKFIVGMSFSSFLTISLAFSAVFGMIVDVVLLIVIMMKDKRTFERYDSRAAQVID